MIVGKLRGLAFRGFRKLGLDVRIARYANIESVVLKNLLRMSGASVVLDVGANVGQYGAELFEGGFSGTLISFEAIPNAHRRLVDRAKRSGKSWIVAPCAAIGSEEGSVEFHISGNSVSSSVLPIEEAHVKAAPESGYVDSQMAKLTRLDNIASNLLPSTGSILLKIDTQGYEMHVLRGATGLLSRVVAIQLELSLVPMYSGAPTFLEMVSYADESGFDLFGIVPEFRDKQSGRLFQVDGFFVKRAGEP
jgi:FkbM family methyltransferase